MTTRTGGHWRKCAYDVISRVMTDNPGLSEKELRAVLHNAYPFGERRMYPYKVWCDEINVQLGKRKFGKKRPDVIDPSQERMF